MRRSRKVFCWLVVLSLSSGGCQTTTYLPGTEAASREIAIKAGDRVRVVTTRRERLTFEVTAVQPEGFIGVTTEQPYPKDDLPGGTAVRVPFEELALLQVTRFGMGAAGAAGVIAAITLSALGAVIGAVAVPVVPPVVP
jgi:hypothetical protein